MSAIILQNDSSRTIHVSKFCEISEKIAELAASVGIRVIPYLNNELPHFAQLEFSARENILTSLQVYLNVYQAVQAEGSSLLDSVRVIWNALTQLGFRPTSDLFSFIKAGNVIEIHGNNSVQMFRNLVFFNFCSYTLEELYCFTMPQLYSRDRGIEECILSTATQIFTGKIDHVVKMDLDPHVITEISSREMLQIKDQISFFAPLYSTIDSSIALLSIENAQIVSKLNEQVLIQEITPLVSSNPEPSL